MLDFHLAVESRDFRHKFKIIPEELSFEHGVKVLRDLFSFLTYHSSYVEAALETICNFSNIRHMSILRVIVFIASKIEVYLLSEEIFQKEVHYLLVLLLLEILVSKHRHTPTHYQLPTAFLVLVDCANWTIAGVSQRTRS